MDVDRFPSHTQSPAPIFFEHVRMSAVCDRSANRNHNSTLQAHALDREIKTAYEMHEAQCVSSTASLLEVTRWMQRRFILRRATAHRHAAPIHSLTLRSRRLRAHRKNTAVLLAAASTIGDVHHVAAAL